MLPQDLKNQTHYEAFFSGCTPGQLNGVINLSGLERVKRLKFYVFFIRVLKETCAPGRSQLTPKGF